MATTEQFSLRWNNFHSNLTSGFHELFEAAEMVDVTLAVDGHFLHAHKIVLSICSPYFKQMFKVNPCKHPIVILKDVGHEHLKDILEFMYMGEVSVLRENLTTFLRTAEVLQVKGLTGDDSSETSSRKDDKLDGENEDDSELLHYNQLMEPEVGIPSHYASPCVSSSPTHNAQPVGGAKRHKNSNVNTNSKRPKSDAQQNQTKSLVKPQSEPEQIIPKIEYNNEFTDSGSFNMDKTFADTDENKDAKGVWENNIGSSGSADPNSSDHDVLMFSTENKGHVFCPYCCRKFVNRYNLKVHVRDKHEENDATDLDCRICGKTMRNQSCLRVHMYHHRKQRMEEESSIMSSI